MRLLVLDAALGPCSAAVLEGGVCVAEQRRDARTELADLPAMAQAVLGAAPVSAVAVTVGPGSFTGLRAAIALAHGVALGRGVPLIGVTVAEAFGETVALPPEVALWVALDTRRGRIFLSRDGLIEVLPLDGLPRPTGAVTVAGDAARPVVQRLQAAGCSAATEGPDEIAPAALGRVALRRLAGELPPCPAQPLYLEPAEARVGAGQRPAPA